MPSPEPTTPIPLIDLSNPTPSTSKKVLDAASTHGFLYIKNDGVTIPPADIAAMFDLSREFFAQPRDAKKEYAIHSEKAGGVNRGWVEMQGESLDPTGQKTGDPKEAFNIAPAHPKLQPLPPTLSPHTTLITRFQTACHTLCSTLLTHLSTALEIPPLAHENAAPWLTTRHDPSLGASGSIFRMLYYPGPSSASTTAAPSIRAGAHSDYGSLTLLFRLPGQPGLEVLGPTGDWTPVPVNPAPDTLDEPPVLVNIGDLLSFWTAGMLKSTMHRVVSEGGGEERYSLAYFCHPVDGVRLERVPGRVMGEWGEKGKEEVGRQRARLGLSEEGEGAEVLTARGHLERRLKVTYGLK